MYQTRDLDILNDDPNTYELERDGPIDMPVTEASDLADRILNRKSDTEILTQLVAAKAHAKIKDTDTQAAFERDQVRITFLALNFAANQRNLLAPAFRERLRPAIRPSWEEQKQLPKLIDAIYSLDRQMIDLHWLYCREVERGCNTSPKVDDTHIWLDGEFIPQAAEHFVQRNWRSGSKAEALHIVEEDQLELGVLRSKQVSSRHYAATRARNSDLLAIKDYCLKSRQLGITDMDSAYNDLLSLRLAKQDIKLAAKLRRAMLDYASVSEPNMDSLQRQLRRRKQLFKEKLKLLR